MRERWIGKEVALCRRAALAEEMLVHFSGISQDHCLVHRLRALISRRASSRGATALASSSLANDRRVCFVEAKELSA
jgi:hypothetical protein